MPIPPDSITPPPDAWYKRTGVQVTTAIAAISLLMTQLMSIEDAVDRLLYPQDDISLMDANISNYMVPSSEMTFNETLVTVARLNVVIAKKSIPAVGPCRFMVINFLGDKWYADGEIRIPRGPVTRDYTVEFHPKSYFGDIMPSEIPLRLECPRALPTLMVKNP